MTPDGHSGTASGAKRAAFEPSGFLAYHTHMAPKITLTLDQSAERELADRADRQKSRSEPLQLAAPERAIHFLRGVKSRATLALPAFYLFHGAMANGHEGCSVNGYPGVVLKHVLEFSSIGTVSLCCRKVFDHRATGLTGANFAKSSDDTLRRIADYWSRKSTRPPDDALAALELLRSVLGDCARTDSALLGAEAPLGRRIGLLKQYADRSAAHLSLEDYEFSTLDCAHVVAAITVIGEIIRSFDDPNTQRNYFDALDEASLVAARHLFPATPDIRLFGRVEIETQARLCWQWGAERGRRMLLAELPYATGWF